MANVKTLFDNACSKIPDEAKVLLVWVVADGLLHCAQVNMTRADLAQAVESLRANILMEQRKVD